MKWIHSISIFACKVLCDYLLRSLQGRYNQFMVCILMFFIFKPSLYVDMYYNRSEHKGRLAYIYVLNKTDLIFRLNFFALKFHYQNLRAEANDYAQTKKDDDNVGLCVWWVGYFLLLWFFRVNIFNIFNIFAYKLPYVFTGTAWNVVNRNFFFGMLNYWCAIFSFILAIWSTLMPFSML